MYPLALAVGSLLACKTPPLCSMENGADPAAQEALFDGDGIAQLAFQLSEADRASLKADPEAEEYLRADLLLRDDSVDDSAGGGWCLADVGVRHKGNTSLNARLPKNPWKVDFHEYDSDRRFGGLEKVGLSTEFGDPTFLRERTSYALLAAAGLPAPRTRYAMLTVNGELQGIYLLIEEIDDVYLERHFEDRSGTLLDVDRGPFLYWGDEVETYAATQGTASVDDGPDGDERIEEMIIDTARLLATAEDAELVEALPERFDVDAWLSLLAVYGLLANLDSPQENGSNYYLYADPTTGLTVPLAWDMDTSFGGYPGHVPVAERVALSLVNPRLTVDPRPMVDRLLAIPEWQDRYLEALAGLGPLLAVEAAVARELAEPVASALDIDPWAIYGGDMAREAWEGDIAGERMESAERVRGLPEALPALFPLIASRRAALSELLSEALSVSSAPEGLEWPTGRTCSVWEGTVTVTTPESPGRLYLLVRGAVPGEPEATWATALEASAAAVEGWTTPVVACLPEGVADVRLLAFVDRDRDGAIDQGWDRVGEVAVDGGVLDAELSVDGIWEGETSWISRYGAAVR